MRFKLPYIVTVSVPIRSPFLADVVGLVTLGLLVAAVSRWVLPNDGFRFVWGIMAYAFLACGAMCMWHSKRITDTISGPGPWAATIGFSLLAGAASFGVDFMVGSMNGGGKSLIETAAKAGSPFGFPLTVLLCPGLTIVAAAALVRSLLPGNPEN